MYNIGRPRFDLLYVVLYYYRHVSLRVIRYIRDIRGVLTLCIHAIERVQDARRFGASKCVSTHLVRHALRLHTYIRDRRLTHREKSTTIYNTFRNRVNRYVLINTNLIKILPSSVYLVVDQKLAPGSTLNA